MGLLDKLEKKIAKHPLADESFETKIHYLNAVAFFIAIDDAITESEKENYEKIINLLDCEDVKDDLYDFLQNPDEDEFENIFKFIDEKGHFITFLLEVFYLHEHNELNELEGGFINILTNMHKYTKDEIMLVFVFAKSIKEMNYEKAIDTFNVICKEERLFEKIDKFSSFYMLSHVVEEIFINIERTNKLSDIEARLIKLNTQAKVHEVSTSNSFQSFGISLFVPTSKIITKTSEIKSLEIEIKSLEIERNNLLEQIGRKADESK